MLSVVNLGVVGAELVRPANWTEGKNTMDSNGKARPSWRRQAATSVYGLSLVCDVAALLTTVDGPAELVLRGTAVSLRAVARALEPPANAPGRNPAG